MREFFYRKRKETPQDEPTLFGTGRFHVSGISSRNGFSVTVRDAETGNSEKFVTKHYRRWWHLSIGPKAALWAGIAVFVFIAQLLTWLGVHVFSSSITTVGQLAALTLLIILSIKGIPPLIAMPLLGLSKESSLRRFHGAEHRLIQVLCSSKPVTADAIRSYPSEHEQCGTGGAIRNIINFLLLGGFWFWAGFIAVLPEYMLLLAILLTYVALWALQKLPLGGITIWMQRHATTAEPTDAEVAEAVAVGQEIEQHYLDYMSEAMLHERGITTDE